MKKILVPILLLIMFIPFYVNAKSKYLYDVLKDEAESGGLAREYIGEHKDSFTEEPSEKIYHWYAADYNEGTTIQDKYNVIFANQCWQMIRTTDTGGVKLIYYGEAINNKCLTSRDKHVGYSSSYTESLNNEYYSGTNYERVSGMFKISGIISDEPKVGNYTCKSTNPDETCTNIMLIERKNTDGTYNVVHLTSVANYSTIGTGSYNISYRSPNYFGYMYNNDYDVRSYDKTKNYTVFYSKNLSTSYWYADTYDYNETNPNKYTLTNPFQVNNTNEYESLVGKYTLLSTSNSQSSGAIYYILGINGSTMYYISISSGEDLSYYNKNIYYGDSYTDNGNGTYSINNPSILQMIDYYNDFSSLNNKYVCSNLTNNTCTELWKITSATSSKLYYYSTNSLYKYANSFTYDNTTNTYTLNNDSVTLWDLSSSDNYTKLYTHHYTCWNTTGNCSLISYVYCDSSGNLYYIYLPNGKNIEEVINEMFNDDNINQKNSVIKNLIDAWYKKYMLEYNDYIEDTIFCNNRNITMLGGWSPNGNIHDTTDSRLLFNNLSTNDLNCIKDIDKFSINNPKAKLDFPVGLITSNEMRLLGHSNAKKSEMSSWLIGPYVFHEDKANGNSITKEGSVTYTGIHMSNGIRPAISLKPKTRYLSGDGSKDNPYIVDLRNYYNIDVVINNETEDLNIEIDDLTQVEEGEEVNFKVTPIKGFKVSSIRIIDENNNEIDYSTADNKNYTFTMPGTDVTIIPSYERVKNAVIVEENNNTKELIIEVNDATAIVYEDIIRFKVVPEEGYEVESIEIIDKDNNIIEYNKTNNKNEYEFIMPDTDVTIKPFYRKIESINVPNTLKNPNTGIEIYIIIIFMLVISSITYITIKRRKNYILN